MCKEVKEFRCDAEALHFAHTDEITYGEDIEQKNDDVEHVLNDDVEQVLNDEKRKTHPWRKPWEEGG